MPGHGLVTSFRAAFPLSFAKTQCARNPLILPIRCRQSRFLMLSAIFVGIGFVIDLLGGHEQVALENAGLLQQVGRVQARH
jgi:hypothetical protein